MNELITYVKVPSGRRKGQLRGVVVAVDRDKIGWSQANEKAGDKFIKERGIAIARTRALNGTPAKSKIPYDIQKTLVYMTHRALRYFKVQ